MSQALLNQAAAGNARFAWIQSARDGPGVPEPRRSASMRLLASWFVVSVLALGCQPESRLRDMSKLAAAERDIAKSNWAGVEKAFKANDSAALQKAVGQQVLIIVDASGSPWTGKALSVGEWESKARFAEGLAGVSGEEASIIAKRFGERRQKTWQVDCKIAFTKKQVQQHFIWPDAVFRADFELLGTLIEASISGHSIRIKPSAIQPGILQL